MSSVGLASSAPQLTAAAAAVADKAKYDPRTRALIEGPIAATLIRLAAPALDLVLLAGDRVSRIAGRNEIPPEPARRPLDRGD